MVTIDEAMQELYQAVLALKRAGISKKVAMQETLAAITIEGQHLSKVQKSNLIDKVAAVVEAAFEETIH